MKQYIESDFKHHKSDRREDRDYLVGDGHQIAMLIIDLIENVLDQGGAASPRPASGER